MVVALVIVLVVVKVVGPASIVKVRVVAVVVFFTWRLNDAEVITMLSKPMRCIHPTIW